MPRTKEFDRDVAVQRAMSVFWDNGYQATSTDDLLRAMQIGRQSMYDTFGDKHRLYLEALQRYQADSGAEMVACLRTARSPLAAIEGFLCAIADGGPTARARGCLAVNATTELGQSDEAVASLLKAGSLFAETAFERVVEEAQRKGELPRSLEARAAARFLLATVRGLRVSAKAGDSPETLRQIAAVALRALNGT